MLHVNEAVLQFAAVSHGQELKRHCTVQVHGFNLDESKQKRKYRIENQSNDVCMIQKLQKRIH